MNLIIDIGNTRSKVSVFDNDKEILANSYALLSVANIVEIRNKYPFDMCILSATGHIPDGILEHLETTVDVFIQFDQQTPLPFVTRYKTPETVGLDRLAAVAGANALYGNANVLIIDAGTAITFDLKSDKGEHLGGNISPGMQMRFEALHKFTHKLPLVKANPDNTLLGLSTNEAINNGVVNGLKAEIEFYVIELQDIYKNLTILLSGGDADFFVNKLKKTIFVVQNLVSIGLNSILLYNAPAF